MMSDLARRVRARRQAPREFRSYVARALVPRLVAFASVAAALLVTQALTADPLPSHADLAPVPATANP